MHSPLRQSETTRNGFTLVELLVVIAIFSIVATLVITGFTINNSDHVGNSISTIKNAIEGARSRAIANQDVRGLRLIPDPNNPNLVRSMIYVESAGYEENVSNLKYLPALGVWRVINIDDPDLDNLNSAVNFVDDTWEQLQQKNLISQHNTDNMDPNFGQLTQPMRIEIPSYSGNWYPVTHIFFDAVTDPTSMNMTRDVVRIAGFYQPSIYDAAAGNYVATEGFRIPYRLELATIVANGAEPIQLDAKTCLDLDGSRVPETWRFREDTNQDGLLNGAETDLNSNNQFDFAAGYSSGMDILFGPDGTITGDVRIAGILHMRVCYLDDAILSQALRQMPLGGNYSNVPGYPSFIVPVDPQNDHKAISLFPQTGAIVVSEIDRAQDDGDMNYNSRPGNTPFVFAVQGAESN